MKILFFILGCLLVNSGFAQQPDLNRKKQTYLHSLAGEPVPFSFPDKLQNLSKPIKQTEAKLEKVLPNGSKLYALPQDRMPCVQPPAEHFAMPVAGKQINLSQQHGFPNLVAPHPILPGSAPIGK